MVRNIFFFNSTLAFKRLVLRLCTSSTFAPNTRAPNTVECFNITTTFCNLMQLLQVLFAYLVRGSFPLQLPPDKASTALHVHYLLLRSTSSKVSRRFKTQPHLCASNISTLWSMVFTGKLRLVSRPLITALSSIDGYYSSWSSLSTTSI